MRHRRNLHIAKRCLASSSSSTYRKSTPPTAIPLAKIFRLMLEAFPLSFTKSFSHWRSQDPLASQNELCQSVLSNSISWHSKVFKVKNPNSVFPDINELVLNGKVKPMNSNTTEIGTKSSNYKSAKGKHLVFIHGYGAGLGFFLKNLQKLAFNNPDWTIHAIDLPGYGCSGRSKFPSRTPTDDFEFIERLYTTPLKEWFISSGLDDSNTCVVAHSMGGYLSAVMAINETKDKNNLNDVVNKRNKIQLLDNFNSTCSKSDRHKFWSSIIMLSPGGIYSKRKPDDVTNLPPWFVWLWNKNVSPFSVVRNLGPLGSKLTSGWTSRRFDIEQFNQVERELMHKYTYDIFNSKASGEYMLNYLLACGAIPRHPLHERIEELNGHHLTGRMVFVYGGHDWMDPQGGVICKEKLNKSDVDVEIIPNAGHHIYLDNFTGFNELVQRELKICEGKWS
ncbi:carboxylic ester hydrolase [Martiniozyma asiatica (nom. inval.)]|nr:carboxylic ester hydrolase [Martiniozyma asiatica]